MNKKVRNITVLFVVFLLVMSGAYIVALYHVWSPEKEVTIGDYTLTIDAYPTGVIGTPIRFNGTLMAGETPLYNQTVTLWMYDGTDYVYTNQYTFTGPSGSYEIYWTPTTPGVYKFKTHAEVP